MTDDFCLKPKHCAQYVTLYLLLQRSKYSVLDREGLCSEAHAYNGIKALVNFLLEQGKNTEAIIIDSIAHNDCIKEEKTKYTYTTIDEETKEEVEETNYRYSHQFNPRKLVRQLNEINEQYFTEYFNKEYKVKDYKTILTNFKKLDNTKLYKEIEKTLMSIKQNPSLLAFVS